MSSTEEFQTLPKEQQKQKILDAMRNLSRRGVDLSHSLWNANRLEGYPTHTQCARLFGCSWTDIVRQVIGDTVNSVTAWRLLSRDEKWELAIETMREMRPQGGRISAADFDAEKPVWMPGGSALARSLGTRWSILCQDAGLSAQKPNFTSHIDNSDGMDLPKVSDSYRLPPPRLRVSPATTKRIWLGQGRYRTVEARMVI